MIGAVGVIVPARDEEATIGACLDALAVARVRLHAHAPAITVRTVIVLDRCLDATSEIVAATAGVEALACAAGQAGLARGLGSRRVLHGGGPLDRLWLANTDADSTVPPDWLVTQVAEADRGAQLVLGTVRPGPGLSLVTEQIWFARHRLREGHSYVHGANFGIRADAYVALGGWPARRSGEDVALVARAVAAGDRPIVRTARMPVCTSARLTGRAPDGFAGYLRGLDAATGEVAV